MEQRGSGGRGADVKPHADLLRQLHLYLLSDLLSLLVTADGEDVAVLQLLLAGTVPKLHGQQLFPHPARERPCQGGAKADVRRRRKQRTLKPQTLLLLQSILGKQI